MADEPNKVVRAPRPAYMIYTIKDGELNVIDVVRKAEDVLALVDKNDGSSYKRFSLK